jgi:hypothetical protein
MKALAESIEMHPIESLNLASSFADPNSIRHICRRTIDSDLTKMTQTDEGGCARRRNGPKRFGSETLCRTD